MANLGFDIENLKSNIVGIKRAIDSLSKYTHINDGSFNIGASEIEEQSKRIFLELTNLIQRIRDQKERMVDFLEDRIQKDLLDEILFNNYENVGSLARQISVDSSEIGGYKVERITSTQVEVYVEGWVNFTLQYGSNRERQEGDGLDLDTSFPFDAKIIYNISDKFPPSEGEVLEFGVNTESWYDSSDSDDL